MYTNIRSTLETLVGSRIGKIELPFPKYFGGTCDGVNDFICVEDLRPSGYVMADKFSGLNFHQASLALYELAKFHAYGYFLIKYKGESFLDDDNLRGFEGSLWLKPTNIFTNFGRATKVAISALEKKDPELANRVRAAIPTDNSAILNNGTSTVRRTDTHYFPVICHGDFWCNNILFKYENENEMKPIGIKFIDFQLSHRGNIFEELQYFIFTSTTPAFRKKYLLQLLDSYYQTFTGTIEKLKCPLPLNFTRGYFIDQFYETYLPALCFILVAIPLQLGQYVGSESDDPQDPNEDPVETICKSLKLQWEESPMAFQRMEEIVHEFIELKLI